MEVYKNLFKRQDIFRCFHELHKKFSNVVSVWHVMEGRGCFPQGCISFYLKCKSFLKGKSCSKGFKKPGRLCQSCKFLVEEKNHYIPKIILKEEEWRKFKREYDKFLFWVRSLEGKFVKFYGKIEAIKPYTKHIYFERGSKFLLKGFILTLKWAYLERDFFEDKLFLYLPKGKVWRLKNLKFDEIEGFATLNLSGGNLFLSNPKNLYSLKGEEVIFREENFLLKIKLGSLFNIYQGKCFECEKGIPTVVENQSNLRFIPKKEIICLEGYASPSFCLNELYKNIKIEKCLREL
ncbi:MAG: hypothetical protein WHV67_05115 [Thermoanaerobaculia bacterium]